MSRNRFVLILVSPTTHNRSVASRRSCRGRAFASSELVLNLASVSHTVQILVLLGVHVHSSTPHIADHRTSMHYMQPPVRSLPQQSWRSRSGSVHVFGMRALRGRGVGSGKIKYVVFWSTRVHTQIILYSVECTRSAALEGGAGLTRQVQRAGVEPLKGGVQDGHLRVTGLGFGGWVRSRVRFYQGLGLRRGCVQDGHLLSEAALGRGLCGLVEAGACGGEQARDRGPPALRVPG